MSFQKCASSKTGEYLNKLCQSCCNNQNFCILDPCLVCFTGTTCSESQSKCNSSCACTNTTICCNESDCNTCNTGTQNCLTCGSNSAVCCGNCSSGSSKCCSSSSSSCCSSGSSSRCCSSRATGYFSTIVSILSSILFVIFSSLSIGVFQSFNSKGPLLLTYIGSIFLSLMLSGARVSLKETNTVCSSINKENAKVISSKIGRITFYHSHHPVELRESNHEFKFRGKYFCTGCYGILAGTLLSLLISSYYLLFDFEIYYIGWIGMLAIIFLLPIVLRYIVFKNMRTWFRFLANMLLPISFCLILIYVDKLYQNWFLNILVIILVILGAYVRSYVSIKENSSRKTLEKSESVSSN